MRPGSEMWPMMEAIFRSGHTCALHSRNKGAAHKKSGNQTRVHDAAKLFQRKIDQVLTEIRSRIVDQDLRMAEALL